MQKKLSEIALFINGRLFGDGGIIVNGVNGIERAGKDEITFLANSKYTGFLNNTKAACVITSCELPRGLKTAYILVKDASIAFSKVIALFKPEVKQCFFGISDKAQIAKSAKIGKNVSIGSFTTIEDGVSIGDDCIIYSNCSIGKNTSIGSGSLFYSNVTIREDIIIGKRVIIQSAAVIGSDGFGFVNIGGKHEKVPQTGIVVIEDDVEVGAGTTIDRARFDKTLISEGTKIDNLVQIAHNVVIGKNCIIVAQVGISGSTNIGDNTIIAGQAGVAGHLNIGKNVLIYGKAGVTKDVKDNQQVSGYPAKDHSLSRKMHVYINKLPRLNEELKQIKESLAEVKKLSEENKK
ncbi:MAG: UDP-3-O-(3-hydroxymyristoyl)glucosamine N-acyltransferase [Candidatus Gygaella obscura]|nr:UDP-3-O-(3-hydroxymyristoyl)glucosamine N-acyltransferase [Candidatus Gygaella obscura]